MLRAVPVPDPALWASNGRLALSGDRDSNREARGRADRCGATGSGFVLGENGQRLGPLPLTRGGLFLFRELLASGWVPRRRGRRLKKRLQRRIKIRRQCDARASD